MDISLRQELAPDVLFLLSRSNPGAIARRSVMSNVLLSDKGTLAEVVKAEADWIEQLPTLLPNATINVNGVMMTIPQIVALLTSHSGTIRSVDASRVTTSELVVTQKAQRANVRQVALGLRVYVAANLGTASSAYSALGFQPTPRSQPSAEVKAEAVLKGQATRAKRHILGKKQRAAIPPASAPGAEPQPSVPTVPNTPTR
jgi:hypothetical protein